MRRKIAGSRLLITGASQGIGRALAEAACRCGGKVLAAARSTHLLSDLEKAMKSAGFALEKVTADITAPTDRENIVAAMRERFGGLDILINNAGIGATGHFVEASPERLRKIMEVNFFGLAEMTRVCLPLLRSGNRPAVVNISSIAGKRGIPARSEYSASKFAIQGFTEALRAGLCVTPTIRPSLLSSIECRKIAANHPKRPEPTGAPGFTEVRRQRQPL